MLRVKKKKKKVPGMASVWHKSYLGLCKSLRLKQEGKKTQ